MFASLPTDAVPRITPAEARDLIERQGALLIDVRGPDEIAVDGRLAGAIAIPHGQVAVRADPGSPHHLTDFRKERPVILYCVSGRRSGLDGEALRELGYEDVYNLGVFREAVQAGWAVEG